MQFMDNLAKLLEYHEGYRQFKYVDTKGNETIGIGFKLSEGFSLLECKFILITRLSNLVYKLKEELPVFNHLSEIRQNILLEMAYQMGVGGLMAFSKMIDAVKGGDFETAAQEMERSEWFREAKQRDLDLQYMMRHNQYPENLAKELLCEIPSNKS